MKKWEAAHITKHLATLIKVTRCSAVLKAGLKAKELLSDEEDQRLTALGQNEGSIREAKLMYEIMMSRTKGYSGLMEVLHEERQDGALKILEALQKPGSQVASSDSITKLMNMRVQLANSAKSFNEVFPNFTRKDAKDLLQNGDLTQELEDIIRKGSVEIKLDVELPLTSDLYLPRLLSNRLQLHPRVFTLDSCVDIFVFTNISRMELTKLVKPHATLSSTGQRSLLTGRHIYLDDDEDWDDMVAISKSPIHLVSKEDGVYILQRTTKVTDVLQNNVLREGRSKEAFVTEDSFVEEMLSDNDSKGALICDVAGMGKTWLMQSLAAKIRAKTDNMVVFFIVLSSFAKFLSGLEQTRRDNEALTIILNYVLQSQFGSHLLYKYAEQNGLKLVLILDGYDEISVGDIDVVDSNLQALSELDHIRMIISSRPNMRAILQKTFNLIAYDILPFRIEEQMRCITEQWAHLCLQSDPELCKLKEFALQCINSVKSFEKDVIHDILGVPLKCRILAAVNEPQAKQLCKINRQKSLQIVEAATIKSVFELYTKYVDCLVDKVVETIPPDATKGFVNGILQFYTRMALEVLFPDLPNVYLEDRKLDVSMEEVFNRVGVASFNPVQNRIEFIHRSFAEYFVGRFFAEFWNDIEQYSPSFVQTVGSYFIKNVMVAVDGEWTISNYAINDDWDLIQHTSSFNDLSFYLKETKMFQMKYPSILFFMNLNDQKLQLDWSAQRLLKLSLVFETKSNMTTKVMRFFGRNTKQNELYGLKRYLKKSSFVTMIACIDERLTNILSLYVHVLISLFDLKERVALLIPPKVKSKKTGATECAVWLLCKAAASSSPQNAVELFSLFSDSEENFLSLLCQRYPEEYWSPVELAIIKGDLDMILYFVDKVSLPFYRLLFACVAVDKKLDAPDVDAKLNIMKMVLGSSDRVLNFLCMDSLCSYRKTPVEITKYSFQLLLKFLEESKRSMCQIKNENKRFILEECLYDCNDEELFNLLLSLYGKSDDKKPSIVNLAARRTFTAEEVLDALDVVAVRSAISNGYLAPLVLVNYMDLGTLKVLTAIQPDFTRCNHQEWNYLHVAADTLNIDWVKHLIKSGYEVDQLDSTGNTPLMTASSRGANNPKSLFAVTRLLVENGANVYAKGDDGRNVAHCVFGACRNADSKDLCEWVSYMLENGYHQLWEMRDKWGRTPQETLNTIAVEYISITTDVLRLLKKYSVVGAN